MTIDCPKLNSCFKIKMVLDKDLLETQYAGVIARVCSKCVNERINKKGEGRNG